MQKSKFNELLNEILSEVTSHDLSLLKPHLISPYKSSRKSFDGTILDVWVFAEIKTYEVCFGYLDCGYDLDYLKWGLIVIDGEFLGDTGAWYTSLDELLNDCGYFD